MFENIRVFNFTNQLDLRKEEKSTTGNVLESPAQFYAQEHTVNVPFPAHQIFRKPRRIGMRGG